MDPSRPFIKARSTDSGKLTPSSVESRTVENEPAKPKWWQWLLMHTPWHSRKAMTTYVLGLLRRAAIIVLIVAVLIALGLGLQYTNGLPRPEDFSTLQFDWRINPGSYLTPFNSSFHYNVLLDGHSHSTYSDGKMNVRQLLDWHIVRQVLAVPSVSNVRIYHSSDHNTVAGGLAAEKLALEEYEDKIVVIPGMEYTIHMNFIDINETVPFGPPVPTDAELKQAIQRVHALGGLVIVNHIPWSNTTEEYYQQPRLPNHPSVAELIEWGVDGFEIVNQNVFDFNTYQVSAQHNMIQMTGTDVHHPSVGANVWLTIQASNMSRRAIMAEIRARRTSFLFDPAGTRPRVYVDPPSAYNMLQPLTSLGSYFDMFYTDINGMYSFQGTFCHTKQLNVHRDIIGWFLFWNIVGLSALEIGRGLLLLGWERLRQWFRERRATADLQRPTA
ncbi:hypothetical protein DFQ28_007912 [Apophysomyces sp. BC1034]|nr:hypothetical protein DFQ30_007408 [Apophysomyces sp. BC1015]KAG0169369.1 hypothetical protein DFQ29_009727 [Apophysomyces sp. BC1021]KAG0186416.1 hypothetical protein DFQ28_007912 [Apophysomyces sp. BC1034]